MSRTTTVTYRGHRSYSYYPYGRFGFYSSYYGSVGLGVSIGFGYHTPRYYCYYRPYRYRCWRSPYRLYPRSYFYTSYYSDPWYWSYPYYGYYSGFYLGLNSLGYNSGYSSGYYDGLRDGDRYDNDTPVINNHYYGDSQTPSENPPQQTAPVQPEPQVVPQPITNEETSTQELNPEDLRASSDIEVPTTFGDRAQAGQAQVVPVSAVASDDALSGMSETNMTFAMGYLSFQEGNFEDASDYFYNASLAEEGGAHSRVSLTLSLIALGEYEYAAKFLKQAIEMDPQVIGTQVDIAGMYGTSQAGKLGEDRQLLEQKATLDPNNSDIQLLQAYIALNTDNLESAGSAALRLKDAADQNHDRQLADQLLNEVESRQQGFPSVTPDDQSGMSFLSDPSLEAIPAEEEASTEGSSS